MHQTIKPVLCMRLRDKLTGMVTQKWFFCYHSLCTKPVTFFILWNTKDDFRQNETLGHHSSSLHLGLYNECGYGLRLNIFVPHIKTGFRAKWGWDDNRSFNFSRTITHDHLVKFWYFHLGIYILLTFVYIIYILCSSDLVQPTKQTNILSSFTHPRVVSNQYNFF